MARELSAALDAQAGAAQACLVLLVLLDFTGGSLRVNNSAIDIEYDGHTWLGVGRVGGIEPVEEGAELQMYGVSMRLSGVDPALIATAMNEQYQGRACKLWLAPLDANHRVADEPLMIFSGRLDVMSVELGATATISLSAESRLVDWERPRARRFNAEDQALDYPADRGFDFVSSLVEKEIRWGF